MRHITVNFEDGNTIETSINGTNESIEQHYIGQSFDFVDSEEHGEFYKCRDCGTNCVTFSEIREYRPKSED